METSPVSFTVTDFSTENPENPAKNLSDKSKKQLSWIAGAAGTPQEFVVLQLEKPVALHSIKVTNNFSGLLEVLGCKNEPKSEATSNGALPWETVVSKSSLMTPLDSRGKKNGNLERDLLLRPEATDFLWDKLKFVCQQPFNKEIPYGLSAIEIQGSSGASNGVSKSDSKSGGFVLKKKEKGESIRVGSLFGSSASGKVPVSVVTGKEESPVTPPSSEGTPPPVVSVSKKEKNENSIKDRVAADNKPIKLRKPQNGGATVHDEDEDDRQADKKASTSRKRRDSTSDDEKGKKASISKKVKKEKFESEEEEDTDNEKGKKTSKKIQKRKKEKSESEEDTDDEKGKKTSKKINKKKKGKSEEEEAGEDEDEEEEEEELSAPIRSRGRPKKETSSQKTSGSQKSSAKKSTAKGKGKGKSFKSKKEEHSEEEDEDEETEEAPPSSSKKSHSNRKGGKSEILKHVMDGCVLALSGFVNPLRSELREKALEMGAKYKPDWSAECTHLVCAFPNTPKFSQVRAAGGRIVKKEWILDCYENQRMPPWRIYMLKPDMTSQNVDDEDELEDAKFNEDEEWEPDASASSAEEEEEDNESDTEVLSEEFSDSEKSQMEDDDEEIAVTDEEMDESELPLTPPPSVKKAKKPAKRKRGVRYDDTDSEDEEELNLTDSEEPDIPEQDFTPRKRPIFRNLVFFLYGDFPKEEKIKLGKIVRDLAGSVKESNDDSVTHCVTTADWSSEFDQSVKENPGLMIVTPDWIYECSEKRNLMDARKFRPAKKEAVDDK